MTKQELNKFTEELYEEQKIVNKVIKWWGGLVAQTLKEIDELEKQEWRPDFTAEFSRLQKKLAGLWARGKVEKKTIDNYEQKVNELIAARDLNNKKAFQKKIKIKIRKR